MLADGASTDAKLRPPARGIAGGKLKPASVATAKATRTRNSCRPEHNHSKAATDLFKAWFYANLDHPFPSDEVKADFADRSGLSYTQVATWFVNARKRVWKPLLRQGGNGKTCHIAEVDDALVDDGLMCSTSSDMASLASTYCSSASNADSDCYKEVPDDHDVMYDEEKPPPPPPPPPVLTAFEQGSGEEVIVSILSHSFDEPAEDGRLHGCNDMSELPAPAPPMSPLQKWSPFPWTHARASPDRPSVRIEGSALPVFRRSCESHLSAQCTMLCVKGQHM